MAMRTITITIVEWNNFTVSEDGRYTDRLCWDEMLGQVAQLTHHKIGEARYPMLTAAEHREHEERQEARLAAIYATNEGRDSK